MNKKWSYGDSWEKYPIKRNELWYEINTGSIVEVLDIFKGLPPYMYKADMIYCDPPWTTGNMKSFYTKAGMSTEKTYKNLLDVLFKNIKKIKPKVCFLEVGKQNMNLVLEKLKMFNHIQFWNITYYRKYPMILTRGGFKKTNFNYTGMDDNYTPGQAILNEKPKCIADFCAGRGLTMREAYKSNIKFVCTELNKRRLAVGIEKISKIGGRWIKF
jgi:hypothetical protein